jgi:hypothetical protein
MTTHVFKGSISLHGTKALYDRRNLERVLDVTETCGFTPSSYGLDERGGARYTRKGALDLLAEPPLAFEQTKLFVRQKAPTKYFAALKLWDQAGVWFEFDPKQSEGTWARMFALADALANAFEPDWGATALIVDLRDDVTRPTASDDERDAALLSRAGYVASVDYNSHGPEGLAMRTYIGPFFADQLGRERIETLPLIVEKLAWGGYRVDLVPEPWRLDMRGLLDAWRRGMAHLRDAGVFAVPAAKPTFASRLDPGPNAKLR